MLLFCSTNFSVSAKLKLKTKVKMYKKVGPMFQKLQHLRDGGEKIPVFSLAVRSNINTFKEYLMLGILETNPGHSDKDIYIFSEEGE